MSNAEIIIEKWKSGVRQVNIAKDLDVSEAFVSQVLAPFKKKKKQPQEPPKVVVPRAPKKQVDKNLLIKYILALNKGHKGYEEYGFTDNHAFLSEIIKMVYDL